MRRRRVGVTGVVAPIGDAHQLAPGLTTEEAVDVRDRSTATRST